MHVHAEPQLDVKAEGALHWLVRSHLGNAKVTWVVGAKTKPKNLKL